MNGIVQHADCEGAITTESTLKEANVTVETKGDLLASQEIMKSGVRNGMCKPPGNCDLNTLALWELRPLNFLQ